MEKRDELRKRGSYILLLAGMGFFVWVLASWFLTGPLVISYEDGFGMSEWVGEVIKVWMDDSAGIGYALLFYMYTRGAYLLLFGALAVFFGMVVKTERLVDMEKPGIGFGYVGVSFSLYVGIEVMVVVLA